MITKFKIFEKSNNIIKYWEVDISEPEFEISLNKLGISKYVQDMYYHNNDFIKDERLKGEKIYIIYEISEHSDFSDDDGWGWVQQEGLDILLRDQDEQYKSYEYINMGKVIVTQKDIDKWNLKKSMKKYNL